MLNIRKPFFHLLAITWLALLILALYGRSTAFEYTDTDDTSLISNRAEFIKNLSNAPTAFKQPFFLSRRHNEGFYRPLATISFMLDAQWNGIEPTAFHITNILLHIAACCLFYFTLTRLKLRLITSLTAVSIFAIHPINTEAVCWIPGRIDILMTLFSLAAFLSFLKYLSNKKTATLSAHLLLTLCALFTKETAAVLPAIFLTYTIATQQFRKIMHDYKVLLGWSLCLGIWAGAWTTVIAGTSSEWTTWLASTIKNIRVVFMLLGKILIPCKMAVLAIPNDTPWLPGLACALTMIAVGAVVRSDKMSLQRYLWACGWYLLLVLPTLPVAGYQILENRIYMPAIGIITALAIVADFIMNKTPHRSVKWILIAGSLLILSGFSFLSYKYSESFRNADTFTINAVKTSPHSSLAHLNRGVWLYRAGQPIQAVLHYQTALNLNPCQPNIANNLGVIRMTRGEYHKAELLFRHELTVTPDSHTALFNLGRSLRMQEKNEEAVRMMQRASNLNKPATQQYIDEFITYHDSKGEKPQADWYRNLPL